jgi:hypothetical protein
LHHVHAAERQAKWRGVQPGGELRLAESLWSEQRLRAQRTTLRSETDTQPTMASHQSEPHALPNGPGLADDILRPRMKTLPILALLLTPALAASAQQAVAPPKPERVETLLAKTVVFIREMVVDSHGRTGELQGTGFLVDLPEPQLGPNQGFGYLVTNRHVAEAIDDTNGTCEQYRVLGTSVTLNLKSSSSGQRGHMETLPIPPSVAWAFPADASVDLAVLPFSLDQNKYDVEYVSLSDFVTRTLLNSEFGIGDKILFAGLFTPFEGTREIQPILRQGMLSMLPDGPVQTTLCRPGVVYLADVLAIAGNSGSPVFITPGLSLGGRVTTDGRVPYALLGVISGYEWVSQNLTLQASTDILHGSLEENSGISVIVPAYQLRALLESAPLQASREKALITAHPKR